MAPGTLLYQVKPGSESASPHHVTWSKGPEGYMRLAHELAHIKLGHLKSDYIDSTTAVIKEIEAWEEAIHHLPIEDQPEGIKEARRCLLIYLKGIKRGYGKNSPEYEVVLTRYNNSFIGLGKQK